MRMVRRGCRLSVFSRRMASSITPEPAPLSVAPVPECQESKCAPIITTSSFSRGSVPGISPTMLNEERVRPDRTYSAC